MPKLSKFNHLQPWRDGNYLAFNAVTGAVGLLTAENHAVYQRLIKKLSSANGSGLDTKEQELMSQLQYGRFIVEDDLAELDWLKFRYRKLRYDPTSMGLVIAPTMACNMACEYCFEANKKGKMKPRVVEAVVGFVEKRAGQLKELQTSWYGGEPLLALDTIADLTESFMDLSEEYDFNYVCGGMISNGYLLDEKATDLLCKLKVAEVQITLDGPARVHNEKRPLKNGRESYETIIRNIQYAAGKLPVVIRVNLDKSFTADIIDELLAELEEAGLRERVALYFGQLEPATQTCANIADSCHETRAFSETEIEYYRLLLERGFPIQKLPHPVATFCFAQLSNSFLIDPDGDMYRCFNYAGDKARSMGNIQEAVSYQHPEFNHLFAFDPFENSGCRTCNILPICMGSCPSRRADRDIPEEEICDSWKYNLGPMLELVALSQMQKRAPQAAGQSVEEVSK